MKHFSNLTNYYFKKKLLTLFLRNISCESNFCIFRDLSLKRGLPSSREPKKTFLSWHKNNFNITLKSKCIIIFKISKQGLMAI